MRKFQQAGRNETQKFESPEEVEGGEELLSLSTRESCELNRKLETKNPLFDTANPYSLLVLTLLLGILCKKFHRLLGRPTSLLLLARSIRRRALPGAHSQTRRAFNLQAWALRSTPRILLFAATAGGFCTASRRSLRRKLLERPREEKVRRARSYSGTRFMAEK